MAIQYLGTTISGVSGDTKPTLTSNELGVMFVETDTDKIYQWDGDSWEITTASDATTSAKGVASFNSDNFAVSSGVVTIKDGGVILGTETTGNYVATVTGTSNQIAASASTGAITLSIPSNPTLPGNVTISGDLTVSGNTTTVNTATLAVEDPLVSLATGNSSSDAVDIGIYGLYDTSGSQDLYGGLFRDANDSGKWKLFKDLQAAPTTTVNVSGTGYATGTLVANLEGTVTGSVTGNAGTVTNGVYTSGAQTIAGSKTLTDQLVIKGDQSALRHQTANGTDRFLTGLRSDLDANDFVFHTYGGDWNFRNGNVGIGISPARRLHVYDDTSSVVGSFASANSSGARLRIWQSSESETASLELGKSTTAGFIIVPGADALTFSQGSTERMRIHTNGNLGIGDDAPETILHLKSAAPDISYEDTDGGDKYIVGNNGGNFRIRNATDSRTDLNIDGAGAASFTGMVTIGQSTTTGFATGADNLIVGDGANHDGMTIYTGNNSIGSISFADAADPDGYSGYIQYGHGTQGENMTFGTDGSPAVTIDSTQTFHTTLLGPRSGDYMYLRTDGNGTKANIRLSDSDSEVQFNNSSNGGILTLGTYINSNARKNLSLRSKYVSSQYKVQVGLNNDDPFQNVAGGTVDLDVTGLHLKDTVAHGQILLEANPPSLHVMDSGGGSNDKWMMYRVDGGLGWFQSLNDDGSDRVDNILAMDMGTGHAGFNAVPKQDWNSSFQAIHLGNQTAFANFTNRGGYWMNNLRYNTSQQFTYIRTDEASVVDMIDGAFRFRSAASGSADANAAPTVKFYIANGGNVGIGGTTTPSAQLEIEGSQMTGLKINDTHASGNPRILLSATSGRVGYIRQQTAGANGVQANWYATNDASSRAFSIAASGGFGDSSALMMVMANGNMGIGLHNPTHKLHLSDASRVDIKFSNDNDDDHYIRKDGDYLRFRGHDDSTVIFELRNNAHSNVSSFPNGRLGVGTDSPSYSFHVEEASGTVPRIYIKSNGSEDAIFDTDAANDVYWIMRRAGTAQWAITNNHAPGTDTMAIYNYVRNKQVMSFQMGESANDVVVGIGCNPTSNNFANNTTIQIGGHASIFTGTTGAAGQSLWLAYNTEQRASSFNAINEDEGSYIEQQNGNIMFKTAPSVTAGSAQTFTERFRIALAGQLGIGGANYGTDGQVLTSQGASLPPQWEDASGGGGDTLSWADYVGL